VIILNNRFNLVKEENNTFFFKLVDEEVYIYVFVLEENIMRILIQEKELNIKNTWWIAPGMNDIPLSGRNKFDLSPFSLPKYNWEIIEEEFLVYTSRLMLKVNLNGFYCKWFIKKDNKWCLVASDRKTQNYNFLESLGEGLYHYLEIIGNESYYGLGEKSGEIDRKGKRFRMLNIDALGYDAEKTDPLYKHIPFYITRNHDYGISFGIFYDVMSASVFDFGLERDGYHGCQYRYFAAESGDLDYYFIAGPSIQEVVTSFTRLTGKPLFPPKWSIGYSGSSMSYTESQDAQSKLLEFLDKCKKNDIICRSFHLSSGYTTKNGKRYVFNWDKSKIPSPQKLIEYYHKKGVRIVANIKPFLLLGHPSYKELKDKSMFVIHREGEKPELAQLWDDIGSYLDFTNINTYKWWKEKIKNTLLDYGIDGTWNDNNEFEVWDSKAIVNGFGEQVEFGKIRALMPLLMIKASFEAQKEYDASKRCFLVSRSGCPGMQRYCQTWSGDNYTEWKTLKYNHYMGIGLTLSGVYNFGHDVGGFFGPAPTPELFLRWIQYGIFLPRFTIHSWNTDGTVNEPWMYPEIIDEVRELINFREKLVPYFYQLFYEAHEFYKPIIRPVFYEFEYDEKTFLLNIDDLMLGPNILVCPVYEENTHDREVYLPLYNDGWMEFRTQKMYEGGQVVLVETPLSFPTFFIRGGSVIPFNDGKLEFGKENIEERAFWIVPHREEGITSVSFFEDDGISEEYLNGEYAFVDVELISSTKEIVIKIDIRGKYILKYKTIKFYLPRYEKRKASVYYKNVQVYSGDEKQIVFSL
jgi:alpha-glucosidase